MKLGLSADPRILEAFWDAGLTRWEQQHTLGPGDIVALGADLAPRMLGRIRGLLQPDVDIVVIAADTAQRNTATGWAGQLGCPILTLPAAAAALRACRTVLYAHTIGRSSCGLYPVRARLTVLEASPGLTPTPDEAAQRDRIRAGLTTLGLPWPDGELALSWRHAPAGPPGLDVPPPNAAGDLAVAAVVLAANGTVPAVALRNRMFIGTITLQGRVRAVPSTRPRLSLVTDAGLGRVVVPTGTLQAVPGRPGPRVEPVDDLRQLVALLAEEDENGAASEGRS